MQIAVDTNQFSGSHGASNRKKHRQLEQIGVELIPVPLPFGDYALIDDSVREILDKKADKVKKKDLESVIKLSVDTKKNLDELCGNVCQQHERFKRELLKPIQHNSKLVILVEHGEDVKCLGDVYFWQNSRKHELRWKTVNGKRVKDVISAKAVDGNQLYKSLCTMRDRYSVDIQFCSKEETGKRIIEILSGGLGDGG